MTPSRALTTLVPLLFLAAPLPAQPCGGSPATRLAAIVNRTAEPLLRQHGIPGLAVAVTVDGQRYAFSFGIASKQDSRPVTEDTIFEVGSISKTFTATLAGYAEATGKLSLADPVSRHLPELAGSRFDQVTLLHLGTYTDGGLPLQFPDEVTTRGQMIAFYRNWRPEHAPGVSRQYSNPSIGLLGVIAARALGQPFDQLMEAKLFPMLGLAASHIQVPAARMVHYAHGYTADGRQVRVNPGMLASEAYGVKTTAKDLVGFVERIIDPARVSDAALRQAIAATRRGYYRIGGMTQSLGWELYPWPVALPQLLQGNSPDVIFNANQAKRLTPPQRPPDAVLINKTGSTNGFGAYVAFVPSRRIGVALLANKNYPIAARVTAGHAILKEIEACAAAK